MAAIELVSTALYTDSKLLAYYKLEDVNDNQDIGTEYNLTNNNTVTFSAAKFNNGGNFNGSNQSLNNNSVLGATTYPRTFTGWFNADSVATNDRAIFTLGDGSVHYYELKIRDSDDHLVFRSNNNTEAADVDTGVVVSTGTWYNFVVVQNSSTSVTIYVNGAVTNTAATTYVATVSQFYLGYLGRGDFHYFDGLIDDVAIFNRALSAKEALNLYEGTTTNTLPYSTLSYWKLDESSGNAVDTLAQTTLVNTNVTYEAGKINNGALFNASTDYLTSSTGQGALFDFERTDTFSYSFWIKPTSLADNQYVISRQKSGANYTGWAFSMGSTGGAVIVLANEGAGSNLLYGTLAAGTFANGTWAHVVVTYSGSSAITGFKAYVNGSEVTITSVFNNLTSSTKQTLGIAVGNRDTSNYGCNSLMDEVGVWSRVLSSTEVTTLYNSGSGIQYPFIAAGPANMKSFNGLASASIKSINGLAIGSIKSINGLI